MGTLVSAFLAGLASVLSPCILPMLPLVFAAATTQHRVGPAALTFGVMLSFSFIGIFVALIGYGIGFDEDRFRLIGAVLLLIIGVALLIPAAEKKVSSWFLPFGNWFAARGSGIAGLGLSGQFVLGLLLGAAWGPCAGPTIGLASAMAMRSENLSQASLIMALFAAGACIPLLLIGMMSREVWYRWRNSLLVSGRASKIALGSICLLVGSSIVAGIDRKVEALLGRLYPEWLLTITTQF